MKKLIILFALVFSAPAFGKECFSTFNLRGWSAENHETMIVDAGAARYKVELFSCTELPWAQRIAFDNFGSRVCKGDKVLVLDDWSNRVKQSCWIRSIELH